jgi:hypothetical protein
MPPKKESKRARKQEEVEGEEKRDGEGKRGGEKFSCDCGKVYGSLAAVHTHINNKHPEEKKKYKALIVNPKKNGQPASTSIRMKDINYPEMEAELMCLADINLKNIYEAYKEVEPKEEILIDVNDDLSDGSDIDIDDLIDESESQRQHREDSSKRQQ